MNRPRLINISKNRYNALSKLTCKFDVRNQRRSKTFMEKLFWIGPRESDILGLESIYSGAVTFYGKNSGNYISYCAQNNIRINHNVDHPDSSDFILDQQLKLIQRYPECKFMYYNPNYAYGAPDTIIDRTICLNSECFMKTLNDKMTFRTFAQHIVPMLNVQTMYGKDCSYSALQSSGLWTDSDSYVIQEAVSSGGQGTFYMSRENEETVLRALISEREYLVSGYIRSNIPLNLHAVIYDQDIVLFPGSIQVIVPSKERLLYRGADFVSFKTLPTYAKESFFSAAQTLCKEIQKNGYRGVLGIDAIWTKQGIFFLEVNNRFQGSTHLLNRALIGAGLPSVQECTIDAFQHENVSLQMKTQLQAVDVPYSSFTQIYDNGGVHGNYLLRHINRKSPLVEVLMDGYRLEQPVEHHACQYTMVFQSNIVTLCDGDTAIRLHPNLPSPTRAWDEAIRAHDLTSLKIGLINQGANICPEAAAYIQEHGGMREGTYFSLDLMIDGAYMNCPLSVKLVSCSPYSISVRQDLSGLCLLYYDEKIADVVYDKCYLPPVPDWTDRTMLDQICFLATDRLRLQNNSYCTFPKHGVGCRFCEVTNAQKGFSEKDILESIDFWFSLYPRPFRHILIGGASNEPGKEHDTVVAMCRRIRAYSDMPIYLMCLPPRRKEDIEDYVKAGVTEFAFNMEVYDRSLALHYMPGKGKFSRERYLQALNWATELLGHTGAVRCSFIAGLEPMDSLLEGIEAVCRCGAAPILSAFRPIPFTEMEETIPPSNEWLMELTKQAERICQRHGLSLGPSCPACRNNTLTYVQAGEALEFRRLAYDV